MEITDLILTRLPYYKDVIIYPHKMRFYSLTAGATHPPRRRRR